MVVFVDGAFWHGRKLSDERFAELPEYWRRKIETNMQRDARNTAELQRTGYMVLRFSDKEVLKQPSEVALDIERIVRSRIDSG